MSANAAVIAVAALLGQAYQCPADTSYDVIVQNPHHLTVVRMNDREECSLTGTLARCKVSGTNGLDGDAYEMYAKVTPDTVTLFAPDGTVCKSHR